MEDVVGSRFLFPKEKERSGGFMLRKRKYGNTCAVLLLMTFLVLLQGCAKPDEGKPAEGGVTSALVAESATPEVKNSPTSALAPTATLAPTASPTPTAAPLPVATATPEPMPTVAPQEKVLLLSERELSVKNELYFEFCYRSERVICRSENPDIAQVMLMDCGYDPEEEAKVAGIMVYGIRNGETEIVITDDKNRQEVRRKVTVEKPEEDTGKQRLIDWLLVNGETNDIGDKVLTEGTAESGGQAVVEYATMDENINFYFKDQRGGEKIEWNLIPTPDENTEYYITMRMGEDFVTATVDLVTYENETLEFEKGWFRIPVEEEQQQRANEISKRAYEAVRTLLYEETGMTMGEVFPK